MLFAATIAEAKASVRNVSFIQVLQGYREKVSLSEHANAQLALTRFVKLQTTTWLLAFHSTCTNNRRRIVRRGGGASAKIHQVAARAPILDKLLSIQ